MKERISKELITDGLAHGLITFRMEYNQLAAQIGEYWFYISSEYGKRNTDYTDGQLVDLIYGSINDYPINDDDDDLATECLYYKAVLEEQLKRLDGR